MIKLKENVLFCYFAITIGTVICTAAYNLFLFSARLAPGGFTGIATILYYAAGIPTGATIFALNIPVLIISYKTAGRSFAARSLFAIVLYSVLTQVIPATEVATDRLLSAVYGGTLMGAGLGIVLYFGGSTGGSDMIAAAVHKRFPAIGVGTLVFLIDAVIIAASAVVFDLEAALFAVPSLFITTKVIEYITEGLGRAKTFLIISDKHAEIKENIYHYLKRGVTEIYARGGFRGDNKMILLCTVQRGAELVTLKNIVQKADEDAFLIEWEAKEVNGAGFTFDIK